MRHADLIEHGHGRGADPRRGIAAQEEGQFDILRDAHRGEEIEKLEDHPELRAPVEGQFLVVGAFQMHSVDHHLAGGGVVQTPQKVE